MLSNKDPRIESCVIGLTLFYMEEGGKFDPHRKPDFLKQLWSRKE